MQENKQDFFKLEKAVSADTLEQVSDKLGKTLDKLVGSKKFKADGSLDAVANKSGWKGM
ncbi:MAG: hypothetical protein ACJAUP_000384 [Cellvibrionaceae bacterium]